MEKNEVQKFVEFWEREFPDSEERLKPKVGYVYILKAPNGLYKIGKSRNPKSRIAQIMTASPMVLELYVVYLSSDYHKLEERLHYLFSDYREHGEWFRLSREELETLLELEGDHTMTRCFI